MTMIAVAALNPFSFVRIENVNSKDRSACALKCACLYVLQALCYCIFAICVAYYEAFAPDLRYSNCGCDIQHAQ